MSLSLRVVDRPASANSRRFPKPGGVAPMRHAEMNRRVCPITALLFDQGRQERAHGIELTRVHPHGLDQVRLADRHAWRLLCLSGRVEEADEPALASFAPLMYARREQSTHVDRNSGLLDGFPSGRLFQSLSGLYVSAGELPPGHTQPILADHQPRRAVAGDCEGRDSAAPGLRRDADRSALGPAASVAGTGGTRMRIMGRADGPAGGAQGRGVGVVRVVDGVGG